MDNNTLADWLDAIRDSVKEEMREKTKIKDIKSNPIGQWFANRLYRHKVKVKFKSGTLINVDAYVFERLDWIKENLTSFADCITFWNWNDEYVIEFRFMRKQHATMFALRWAQ